MEDDEVVNSTSLCPFDRTLEMDIQLHEKREISKYSTKGKKCGNRNSRPIQKSPTPTEIAKEALEIGKILDILVVRNETPTIRRITRSLQNKIENNEQV